LIISPHLTIRKYEYAYLAELDDLDISRFDDIRSLRLALYNLDF